MIPFILTAIGGYLIGDSIRFDVVQGSAEVGKLKTLADGGELGTMWKVYGKVLFNGYSHSNIASINANGFGRVKLENGDSIEISYLGVGVGTMNKREGRADLKSMVMAESKYNAIEKAIMNFELFMGVNVLKGQTYLYAELPNEDGELAKGGMVVTSIKDIPNLKEKIKNGQVTYRGLGMGKLSNDFYELTGDTGFRIKVDGKEYYITEKEFDKISRDKNGNLLIRFNAPFRR